MMRVITANLNGIRSAAKKGFFDWLGEQNADCVCVQEIKVSADDLPAELTASRAISTTPRRSATAARACTAAASPMT